ncbi:sirohydrochlorin cobaltochelatase [Megasphaera vaginalis (ex Srinivasan et al. 2021)]|uniref:Cobalt chelatase CbiK n=1 Tax=Megasphaera vaginalis (ex Srinivasan et al. 2021) TaxID=1111454 RepID=U7UT93_9FIRM|nr:sirohydrochlorin cobaltochelatase [Megasphaera vaginalis (ex Srinivasan et al. 2021)]ERT61653.1 cobalt chelatase CbiK [Megasphaera vaginalis (ex Srinivasan et al. 2021)]
MFKKNMKRLFLLSLAITSFGAFTGVPAYAGYSLNTEVKDATPALKEAAAIGVRTYTNEAMKNAENKDAILVLSFGTTYKDSRAANIDRTVAAIQAAHPDTKVVLAFTSHIIVDRIKSHEGLAIPTPEQALEQLKEDGYTRIAITSLDVIPGMEYAYDTAVYNLYKENFKKMTIGTPILYWMGQEGQRDDLQEFVGAFSTQFPKLKDDEALLLMAHGTPHPGNAYYSVVQDRLNDAALGNVFIYSVEGWPHLDTVIPKLKAKGVKHVVLMPMMMVAGDHANNDMAGAESDSHKSVLEKEGFTVSTYIHGLGENEAVRKMFVERANEAWQALEKD